MDIYQYLFVYLYIYIYIITLMLPTITAKNLSSTEVNPELFPRDCTYFRSSRRNELSMLLDFC